MIVVFCHIKGGVGKTSIAINATVQRSLKGERVLLVDADAQGTASEWVAHRQALGHPTPWTTVQLHGAAVRSEVQKLAPNFDVVIIDCGGRDTGSLRAALSLADVALVPCAPRSFDLWSLQQLAELVQEAKCINDRLQCKVFLNMGDSRGQDNDSAKEIISGMKAIDEVLPIVVGHRKAFANAASEGLSVGEFKPKDRKAASEMEDLEACLFDTNLISQ